MVTVVENFAETIAILHDINVHVLFPLPRDRVVCTVWRYTCIYKYRFTAPPPILDIIAVITSPDVCDHVDTYVYMYGTVYVVKPLDNVHRVYSGLISDFHVGSQDHGTAKSSLKHCSTTTTINQTEFPYLTEHLYLFM